MRNFCTCFLGLLIASGLAYADGPSNEEEQEKSPWYVVESNTEPSGFYIGLMGMYALPTETGLGTFIHSLGYDNNQGGVTALSEFFKPHYRPAGGIELGYDFGGSGNKLEASYFYLHNSKRSHHHSNDNPVTFGSAFFNVGVDISPGTPIPPSILKYTVDQADLKFGHRLITSSRFFEFTFLVGVRYAYLKHDLPFPDGYLRSRYSGGGPLIGCDLTYDLYKGFLLVGEFNMAWLMGSVKSSSSLTLLGTNTFKPSSNRRIVSNFEGRLGLAYDWLFYKESSFRIEAGYEMNYYIGPFDMVVAYTSPSVQRISDLSTTNFAYSGPYLKLTWHM